MAEKGRKDKPSFGFVDTVAPGDALQATLMKQDEIIDKLNALLAKLDSDTVGGADYESVIGATEKAELK